MSLSPRAIATQGIGRSPRLVAVQGLWPDFTFLRVMQRRSRVPLGMQEDDALLLIAVTVTAAYGRLI